MGTSEADSSASTGKLLQDENMQRADEPSFGADYARSSYTPYSLPPRVAADLVTSNLMKLGTLTLQDFLSPPYHDPPPPEVNLTLSYVARPATGLREERRLPAHQSTPLFLLHQVCSQTFGSIDPLKYEFVDDISDDNRQCILTITRPNGSSRSYTYKASFSRKADARDAVAAIAVDMGAIDFIKNGAPDHLLKRGLVLAPLDTPEDSASDAQVAERPPSEAVVKIERSCVEWRAGRVKPHWVALREFKPEPKFGCVLRIALSSHSTRIYSVDSVWDHYEDARSACAEDAVAQGVLEFIMHGNGQKHPAPPDYTQPGAVTDAPVAAVSALSVQGFFDSLPRPFPEPDFEGKSVNDINAPSWLNQLAQAAKGARISVRYSFVPDTKYGLHGALLRVERPSECKSYFVDPLFPKRADAKTAVCLTAMSQGVGDWLRKITREYDEKISFSDRERIMLRVIPLIMSEYSSVWPGRHPEIYSYSKDMDAHGCTLTLQLSLNPGEDEKKTWSVPTEYKSRSDARLAVVDIAFKSGAVEFLRFRGKLAPEGYVVELPEIAVNKRKNPPNNSASGGHDFKRQKKFDNSAPRPYNNGPVPHRNDLSMLHQQGPYTQRSSFGYSTDHESPSNMHPMFYPHPYPGPSAAHSHSSFGPPATPSAPFTSPDSGPSAYHAQNRMPYPQHQPPRVQVDYAYYSTPPAANHQPYPVAPYGEPEPLRYDVYAAQYDAYLPPPAYYEQASYADVLPRSYYAGERPSYPTSNSRYPSVRTEPDDAHEPGYIEEQAIPTHPTHTPSSSHQQTRQYHRSTTDPDSVGVRRPAQAEPRVWKAGPGASKRTSSKATAQAGSGGSSSSYSPSSSAAPTPPPGKPTPAKPPVPPAAQQPATSARDRLAAHCAAAGIAPPQMFHEEGPDGFRVWAVVGRERMELQTKWKTIKEGEEKLCKQILKRKIAT